ncbi:hypothetical protein [Haloechinothrix sp. LS1_15]|nr:hypothetical protein [Haloechinothrix sp. LS1_15]
MTRTREGRPSCVGAYADLARRFDVTEEAIAAAMAAPTEGQRLSPDPAR